MPLDPARSHEGEQYLPLPEGLLTTVILGSRVEEADRDRVLELLAAEDLFREVEVLQVRSATTSSESISHPPGVGISRKL